MGDDPQDRANEELIGVGDLDALTERVDSLCFDDRWSLVVDLRDRCLAAASRGKQLWPAAAYAEHRMALDGPAAVAASVCDSTLDRFTLGPFAEVMASTHAFADLEPWLPSTPGASVVAHERVLRGEDLRDDAFACSLPDVLGLPLALQAWEPEYPVATYHPSRAELPTPSPLLLGGSAERPGERGRAVSDPATCRALTDLVSAWTNGSNGRAEAVAVEGGLREAIAALGPPVVRVHEISPQDALAWMAWAAGNGGAHGRRRGMAAGRQSAWWALSSLAGLAEEHDVTPDELGEAARELRWALWDDGSPDTGWSLRLAVEDPIERLAWALAAIDAT